MVFEKVRAILADQFDVDEEMITPETNIEDDLGADSLDVIDLVMSVEDEFSLEVPEDVIESLKTVDSVVRFIEENA